MEHTPPPTSTGLPDAALPGQRCAPTEAIRRAVLATIQSIAPDADVHHLAHDRPVREQVDLDSMDWLNVVAGLHEQLGTEIPESVQGRLETVDAIVDYLASRQADAADRPASAPAPGVGDLPTTQHRIDGRRVVVRPMRPEDKPMEAAFVRGLSAQTRYNRFMVTMLELPPGKLDYLTDVDQVRHVALVATVATEGRQVQAGVARYFVDAAGTACEFAVAVDDRWQGSGLAGILMQRLMALARSRGLATMEGLVLRTNAQMLKLARQLGFRQQRDPADRDAVRVVRSL